MITKAKLLECSTTMFTQLGSKHVTLDDLASTLGISKKTIYTFFNNKEELVTASLENLLNQYKKDIDGIVADYSNNPILCVLLIYKKGFEYLKHFKPTFIFGLEKYYPKAILFFNDFIENLANNIVLQLLKQAQANGDIKKEVNLEIVVNVYFLRIDKLVFKKNNLFELYPKDELFKHLVVYNLKGIITNNYSNSYFE